MSGITQLDNGSVKRIAKKIAALGPHDHGANKNRWGSVRAMVAEARRLQELGTAGSGDDEQRVYLMVKRILASRDGRI